MPRDDWMLYGATGYTGQLIAQEAVRRGHRPLLAGRSEQRLAPLADSLGLPYRVVPLDDAAELRRAVEQVRLVFHAAGPFVQTSAPMVRACLDARASYVDITGELPVFQQVFARDEEARRAGVVLLSGAGFDVVPTDCLAAHVARALPGTTGIEEAVTSPGPTSVGTGLSALGMLPLGIQVRRQGRLVRQPLGRGAFELRFADRPRWVMPVPLGDLETAPRTTGAVDVTAYLPVPRRWARALRAGWPAVAALMPLVRGALGLGPLRRPLEGWVRRHSRGPDEQVRQRERSMAWARATDAVGNQREAWLVLPEAYHFTALCAVRVVEALGPGGAVGATTPGLALGADFVLGIEGTRRLDALP